MRNRSTRIHRILGMMMVAVMGGGILATAQTEDELDRQLLESLEGKKPTDGPALVIQRLLENTESAGHRLSQGQVNEQTRAIQQQILDDIDALLEQAGSPPPQGSPPPSSATPAPQSGDGEGSQSSAAQAGSEAAGDSASDGNGQPSEDPNAASRESEERTTPGEETAAERERRLGLATAAWGHLPPKVREQMRSAFSETYLPEYDDLVRRYYEALAARRDRREMPESSPAP